MKKKRKIDVWLKILFGTCLEESLKANNRDGAEKRKKGKYKEIINVALYIYLKKIKYLGPDIMMHFWNFSEIPVCENDLYNF